MGLLLFVSNSVRTRSPLTGTEYCESTVLLSCAGEHCQIWRHMQPAACCCAGAGAQLHGRSEHAGIPAPGLVSAGRPCEGHQGAL